jgi:hypothetical protein
MIETQSSQLLPALFEYIDEDRRLTVLHLGPALPETVEFFSRYRSKLFFADLFGQRRRGSSPWNSSWPPRWNYPPISASTCACSGTCSIFSRARR